jgi:predicted small lipoprotein YifL
LPSTFNFPGTMKYFRYPVFSLSALLFLIALTLLPSCGRKGALIVPGTVLPAAVTDLKAEPRAGAIILSFTMPEKNTKGDPLTDLAGFVIMRAEMPEDKDECPCKFEKAGYVDLEFPKDALIKGKKVVWADRGPGLIFGRKYAYKAAAENTGGFTGEESAAVYARYLMPPVKPAGLAARALNRAALITWEPVTRDEAGNTITDIAGYNVYRAVAAGETAQAPVNPAPVTGERYEDFNLTNNVTYYYTVTALRGKEPPLTEGDAAGAVAVTPSDKEPPAPPVGLQAVPGEGMALLSWEPGPEPDIAGYFIYRLAEGEKEFKRLNEAPYARVTYRDQEVTPGVTYTYEVTAADTASPPNESPRSEGVTVKIPERE